MCKLDERKLVLFHKNGNSLVPKKSSNCSTFLRQLGHGPVVELNDNDWVWCGADVRDFNCHAMAIGSGVGLTPQDWLEGFASEATLQFNPAQVILDAFYEPVNSALQENDVFVLLDSTTGHLTHSGILRWVDGNAVAISKFGEGPVLMTSFALIAYVYSRVFDEVRWYRRRS